MVEKQGSESGEFFAAARSSRAAVEAAWHNVAMPGELRADAGIHNHNSAMQIADAKHDALEKGGIVRKNRSDKRTQAAPRYRD